MGLISIKFNSSKGRIKSSYERLLLTMQALVSILSWSFLTTANASWMLASINSSEDPFTWKRFQEKHVHNLFIFIAETMSWTYNFVDIYNYLLVKLYHYTKYSSSLMNISNNTSENPSRHKIIYPYTLKVIKWDVGYWDVLGILLGI